MLRCTRCTRCRVRGVHCAIEQQECKSTTGNTFTTVHVLAYRLQRWCTEKYLKNWEISACGVMLVVVPDYQIVPTAGSKFAANFNTDA
jgi:hypothetical protein